MLELPAVNVKPSVPKAETYPFASVETCWSDEFVFKELLTPLTTSKSLCG